MYIKYICLILFFIISNSSLLIASPLENKHQLTCSDHARLAEDVYENKKYGISYDQWLSQHVVAHKNLVPLEVAIASIIYDDPTVRSRGDAHQYALDICSDLDELKKIGELNL